MKNQHAPLVTSKEEELKAETIWKTYMITVSNLQKTLSDKVLFEKATFNLNSGSCYGLVGANGAGKSTLLKMIAGDEEISDGVVTIAKSAVLGRLRQDQFLNQDESIINLAMQGKKEVFDALKEQEQLSDHDQERFAYLQEVISHKGGFELRAQAGAVLEGLGIETALHEKQLSVLSGGFRWRVLLAQVLVSEPDVLLLDEPTNHLDIISVRFLEKFLQKFEGCVVVISHDRRFLDQICTHILDIDYGTVTLHHGNYQEFLRLKKLHSEQKDAEIARQKKEIAHKMEFVDRFRAKASKARQAQSRLKQIERIQVDELVESSRRYPNFKFDQIRPSGREVLKLKRVGHSYGDKQVLKDVTFDVQRGEKVAIIGPNGVGKSTLLKRIVEKIPAQEGRVEWGYEPYVGYFAQDHEAELRKSQGNVENWLWQFCQDKPRGFVRSYLGAVLFVGDDVQKSVQILSGGESARLVIAKIMLQQPNVLILDEPTNHLDLEAIEALVTALKEYPGTLIFVSHDRWFVSEIATRVIELTFSGVNDFKGTYEEYLANCGDDHLDTLRQIKSSREAVKATQEVLVDPTKRLSKNKKRQLQDQADKIMQGIQEKEQRLSEIDLLFSNEQFYQSSESQQIQLLYLERDQLQKEISHLFTDWEQLENQLNSDDVSVA